MLKRNIYELKKTSGSMVLITEEYGLTLTKFTAANNILYKELEIKLLFSLGSSKKQWVQINILTNNIIQAFDCMDHKNSEEF